MRVKYWKFSDVLGLTMDGMFCFAIYMFPESKYVCVFLVLIAMSANSEGGKIHIDQRSPEILLLLLVRLLEQLQHDCLEEACNVVSKVAACPKSMEIRKLSA